MVKVLVVVTKSNWGCAQRYVFDIASGLPRDQFQVLVVAGEGGLLLQKLEAAGIRAHLLPYLTRDVSPLADLRSLIFLFRLFATENPDIVHLNSSKIGILGGIAGRLTGIRKIIFTAHGWAFNENRPFFQRVILKLLSWLAVCLSHKTIAVSSAVAKDLAPFPLPERKLVVARHGLARPYFLSRLEARNSLCKANAHLINSPDEVWIGTIAELHSVKGLRYAIEAIAILRKRHPTLRYLIVGEGEERGQLEALVKTYGLKSNVFLVGFLDEASQYLHAFDLFVLPSLSEGLGIVLLEAALAGVPVVATRVGGVEEVISHGQDGLLVDKANAQELALGVESLLADEARRNVLAQALRRKVLGEFTKDGMIEKTLQTYLT